MKKIVWVMNTRDKTGLYNSPAVIWWYGILENLGYEVTYYSYEQYNIEDFIDSIKEYKPDFTIVAAYSTLHTELIKLKPYTKLLVLQSDDRWRYDIFGKFWIPFIDGVITFEGELEKYVHDGLKPEQFHKMRWSFNPNTMASINNDTNVNKQLYISHTGGLHGDRKDIIAEFRNKGVNVIINQNPNYEITKNIWNYSRYSLCLTMNSIISGRELKGRVVEIPNWCVLLTQPFPDMEQYYDMDKECVLFETIDEAIEKIKYLDNNPDDLRKIFEAGKRRLWNSNTVYHEWNKILPGIDPDYKPVDVIKLLKEKHGDYYYA